MVSGIDGNVFVDLRLGQWFAAALQGNVIRLEMVGGVQANACRQNRDSRNRPDQKKHRGRDPHFVALDLVMHPRVVTGVLATPGAEVLAFRVQASNGFARLTGASHQEQGQQKPKNGSVRHASEEWVIVLKKHRRDYVSL